MDYSYRAMICCIIAGASFLSVTMGCLRIPATVATAIGALKLSPYLLMLIFGIFYVIQGCFLDGISMIVKTFPLGVIEVGQITPPVGRHRGLLI